MERTEQAIGALPGARIAHAGVDEQLFQAAPEHPWRWRLLYCGRIDPRKGIDLAVASLPLLPAEATLLVVGDGDPEHRAELERLARELGVADRVRFERVERDRLPATFAEHDALLFPVRWEEPWGLVPLEAMAVGLLVVGERPRRLGRVLRGRRELPAGRPGRRPGAARRRRSSGWPATTSFAGGCARAASRPPSAIPTRRSRPPWRTRPPRRPRAA